jgi:chloride channel 3/4/5
LIEAPLPVFVEQNPLTICAKIPIEYTVKMFRKLGLRHLIMAEEGSSKVVGVIIKKRLRLFLSDFNTDDLFNLNGYVE